MQRDRIEFADRVGQPLDEGGTCLAGDEHALGEQMVAVECVGGATPGRDRGDQPMGREAIDHQAHTLAGPATGQVGDLARAQARLGAREHREHRGIQARGERAQRRGEVHSVNVQEFLPLVKNSCAQCG